MNSQSKPRFYEFFAGAGLARLGLGDAWDCVWANDIDPRKAALYTQNFGVSHFVPGDVSEFRGSDLDSDAEMAWASFPCQDLSLAGWRRGLAGERSGAFWAFWRIMKELAAHGRRPPLIVLENVVGMLYGDSFAGLCEAMVALDMQIGALVVDARHFVPQSRPRVFLIAVDGRFDCSHMASTEPPAFWAPAGLTRALEALPCELQAHWRWWSLPIPERRVPTVSNLVETQPQGVDWHSCQQTRRLLDMMSDRNRARVEGARTGQVGFLYKRIRDGVQRAEVRFDGLSGCLRTPRGGSSRQVVVVVLADGSVRTRLLSPREAARLMGVPESYRLPERYNDAYKAMGDGVVVPVVSWLSEHLLLPLAAQRQTAEVRQTLLSPHQIAERLASEWQRRRAAP